jgi:hypothetical protein
VLLRVASKNRKGSRTLITTASGHSRRIGLDLVNRLVSPLLSAIWLCERSPAPLPDKVGKGSLDKRLSSHSGRITSRPRGDYKQATSRSRGRGRSSWGGGEQQLSLNGVGLPTAERLKAAHRPIADQFDSASFLFADVDDLTPGDMALDHRRKRRRRNLRRIRGQLATSTAPWSSSTDPIPR